MKQKRQTSDKDFTSLPTIINEAKKAYYAEYKKIKAQEDEVTTKKAELAKLGGFLKSQGVDPEELVKMKIEKSEKLRKARKSK